jgi:hypothetical protein
MIGARLSKRARTLVACASLCLPACSGAEERTEPAGGADLYPAVSALVDTSCGFARCHGPGPLIPGGGLLFAPDADIRGVLVDVPACEYPLMKRVAPGDPDRSWLMVKLTAPRSATGELEFEPELDFTPVNCGIDGFGFGMPALGTFSPDAEAIATFRDWILAGAGGPE